MMGGCDATIYCYRSSPADRWCSKNGYTPNYLEDMDPSDIPVVFGLCLLTLPSDLQSVESEAFMNSSCEAVILPEGCVSVGARAFANCPRLRYIRIPSSVVSIAGDAFEGSDSVVIDRG